MGPIQGVLTRRPACGSQESEGSSSYAKKTLTLTVLESADVSGRNPTEVGTLVLNLAEFASTEGRTDELRKVVKASGAITTVVGDPFLAFSIRCTAVHKALPSAAGDSLLGALPRPRTMHSPLPCRTLHSVTWNKNAAPGGAASSVASDRCGSSLTAATGPL